MKTRTILPADTYVVINKTVIDDGDRKLVSMLYQPIIGYSAVSLYFTLLDDLDKSEVMSGDLSHHHLMSLMQLKLDDIVIDTNSANKHYTSKYEKEMLSFLPQALKKGQIYIISDIDFLYDETWSDNSFKNKNTTYGIVPWSENGLLLERILNSLNEKEDLTTLGIHPFLPKDSLGTKFKKEAEQDVSQAKEEKTQQLEQLLNKAEGINYQDYSLGSAKQINQLQEQITSLEKELRYLDYATDKAYKQKMKIYTMLSVILMLVYAGFITLWLRHRLKKRRISQEKN